MAQLHSPEGPVLRGRNQRKIRCSQKLEWWFQRLVSNGVLTGLSGDGTLLAPDYPVITVTESRWING